MAKTKDINDRPIILVTKTVTKWNVEKLRIKVDSEGTMEETNEYVLTAYSKKSTDDFTFNQRVNLKEETANTGSFRIIDGRYHILLQDGSLGNYYSWYDEFKDHVLPNVDTCLKFLKAHPYEGAHIIERTLFTYFNSITKETTRDLKVAKNWFKGQNPIFVMSSPRTIVGAQVTGGKDYVDVSYYYCYGMTRNKCGPWEKAKMSGFRLYNDGTISHFYKGSIRNEFRAFCEQRIYYRSFDPRIPYIYGTVADCIDLNSTGIVNYVQKSLLSSKTKRLLQKAGFPEKLWLYGDGKRSFSNTNDLYLFVKCIQQKPLAKKVQSIDDFLKDKPFGPNCENFISFDNGVLIRIPHIKSQYQRPDGGIVSYPYLGTKLISKNFVERYRVWISNDGRKRKCLENIHEGTLWTSTTWDRISFPSFFRNSQLYDKEETQTLVDLGFGPMLHKLYDHSTEVFPFLARIKDFVKENPPSSRDIKNLLNAFYVAPKITETLIKIGYGNWFRSDPYRNDLTAFSLDEALEFFGLRECGYEEKVNNSFYQNLMLSKEQFMWIVSKFTGRGFDETEKNFKSFIIKIRNISIAIPGKNSFYKTFADVPVKCLESLWRSAYELIPLSTTSRSWYTGFWNGEYSLARLLEAGFTYLDIEKVISKKLNVQTLEDYLRMRSYCLPLENFDASIWPKMPTDNTDLKFCHDRMVEFYNLTTVQREEIRLTEEQKEYAKRYEKLKTLEFTTDEDERVIVVPKELIELVVEGQKLHHCVGGYTESVAKGYSTIVFLRKKNDIQTPYATIELHRKGEDEWLLCQAHTAHNHLVTKEDKEFLVHWGQKNKIVNISRTACEY